MFTPSQRQQQATASMEGQLGIRRPRQDFADVGEWEAYFQRLQQRCQRQRAQDPAARRQRREQRLASYYDNVEHLRQYAMKYLLRYQPSTQALLAALQRKCADGERCQGVLASVAEHLDDAARAWELADGLHASGKNRQDIRERLMRRRFSQDCIQETLARLDAAHEEAPLDADAVHHRVERLQRKGMSSSAIVGRLASSAPEREQLKELMGDSQDEDQRAAEELCRKYLRQGLEPRRIRERLARRGFRGGVVSAALKAMQDQQ